MQKREKEKKKIRYDPNDGLLPEIRKRCGYMDHREEEVLVPRGSTKKKKFIEEEWKWPEAQICGICAVGGDILCCETCPASFHLSCIGFEASDFPDDNFFCNRCKNIPKGVQLSPPNKSVSTVCPQSRIENENERNLKAIEFHYNRLRQEEANRNFENGNFGPMNTNEIVSNVFPDMNAVKALAMANPMDYTLPADLLAEREFEPNDSMEEKRPHIVGEECVECGLKDDWTPMLSCDYCEFFYHQKCVTPPMITIPRMSYWRCPRHTESLIDILFQGEEISKEEKKRLFHKYDHIDDSFETFELFCKSTEELRIEAKIEEYPFKKDIYYEPQEDSRITLISSVLSQKKLNSRKGGRGKKKNEMRLFDNVYSIVGTSDQSTSKASKSRQKTPEPIFSERKDRNLDKLDQKRSQKFTEEDLIMSIAPFDEKRRAERAALKQGGTECEATTNIMNRHAAMVAKSKTLLENFSEKELTRLLKNGLDPLETFRGSGVQNISAPQEKSYRKKMKVDTELLIQQLAIGSDHADRRFNSFNTEAFFRRCAPPTSAQDTLNQRTLRESVMSSQKEAYEGSRVYKYHPIPENLEHFILLGYTTHFESAKERDEYFVSSMTPWSKEPIAALTAKWAEENRAFLVRPEAATDSVPGTSNAGQMNGAAEELVRPDSESKNSDEQSTSEKYQTATSPGTIGDEIKKEEEDEEREGNMNIVLTYPREGSFSPSERDHQESPIYHPPDSPATLIEKLSALNFEGLKMKEEYEKAESVYEVEGYFGEFDDIHPHGFRRIKSESDIVDRPYWPAVHMHLQNLILRTTQHEAEHNYSHVYIPPSPSNVEPLEFSIPSPSDYQDFKFDDDDVESYYSAEFAYPYSPPDAPYDNFAEPARKRGRPIGSKNRKEGEAPPKRKRNSVSSNTSSRGGRGRGGRPRGSRSRGGMRSVGSSIDGEAPSRRQSQTFSSDAPESPEPADVPITDKLRQEVAEAKMKYTKMLVKRMAEQNQQAYFDNRDDFLFKWTDEQRREHREVYIAERMRSLIPYDQRYFLPNQRVLAKLEINSRYLPIAIQRCLTKFGTAQDCHVRLNHYTTDFCPILSEYHCDIVRDYYTDTFFLSTLATEVVVVNGIVIRRPRLTEREAAERLQAKVSSTKEDSNLKCQCQVESDQLIAHQESCGKSIESGIVKLGDGAKIQIGCATFTFKRV
ncbi:unnamed protein product [Caenorhabditis brenneri]